MTHRHITVEESHLMLLALRHPPPAIPDADAIVGTVCGVLGVSESEFRCAVAFRTRTQVRARMLAALLLRRWLGMSYPQIAAAMSTSSHGTTIHRVSAAAHALHTGEPWLAESIKRVAYHLLPAHAEEAANLAHHAAAYALNLSPLTRIPTPTSTGATA